MQVALQTCSLTALQLIGKFEGATDALEICVESSDPQLTSQTILSCIALAIPHLTESVEAGNLALTAVIMQPGAIPRNPRTGKTSAIVDRRFT